MLNCSKIDYERFEAQIQQRRDDYIGQQQPMQQIAPPQRREMFVR
jgi:hypothetical protein